MILRYPPRRARACDAPRRFSAGPGGLARIDGGLGLWQSNHSTANSRANVCPHESASSRCLEEFLRWRDFGADTSLRFFSRHPIFTQDSKSVGRTFTGPRTMEALKDQTLSGEKPMIPPSRSPGSVAVPANAMGWGSTQTITTISSCLISLAHFSPNHVAHWRSSDRRGGRTQARRESRP